MPPPLLKIMKGVPKEHNIHGIMYNDPEALTPCQTECIQRLSRGIKIEQAKYYNKHPEIRAMLQLCVSKMMQEKENNPNKPLLETMSLYFARPINDLDEEIRKYQGERRRYDVKDNLETDKKTIQMEFDLTTDVVDIIMKHYPPEEFYIPTPDADTIPTRSSSFISVLTSQSTLATPELTPPPPLTMTDIIFKMLSNTLDKATLLRVSDYDIKYDTAYVELMKVVEKAMEIPVIEIRLDIIQLFNIAYGLFENIIIEREQAEAELAWENRMRKKLKRLLRRQNNFRGYETPSTPSGSSHPSYKLPQMQPCVCSPQWTYNRYPKDRFGIYLPSDNEYFDCNITVSPPLHPEDEPAADTKSISEAKAEKVVAFEDDS